MKLVKLIFFPLLLIKEAFNQFVIYLPGNTGIKLRYVLYKWRFKTCGKRVYIEPGVHIKGFKYISLGSDVHIDKNVIISTGVKTVGVQHDRINESYNGNIGEIKIGNHTHIVQNCIVMGYGGIEIGNHCTISAGSKIYSQSNLAYDPADKKKVVSIMPYETAHFIKSPIVFDDNVWLGLNTIIMPGATIGKDSFVVSNSLVKNQFPANSYISGQPATKKKNRFE